MSFRLLTLLLSLFLLFRAPSTYADALPSPAAIHPPPVPPQSVLPPPPLPAAPPSAIIRAATPAPPSSPTIWSGIIIATNNPHPAPVPSQISGFAQKLRNIFGYNQFELAGENTQRLEAPYEHWLIPSKEFYLSIRSHTHPGNPLKVSLFQNRHRIADFDAHLAPDSPLFIRGPLYARGQLIIILLSR